jgi:hypothetical protein
MLLSGVYKPHTYSDLERLVEQGHLTENVLKSLDSDKLYGVWWYNQNRRDKQKKKSYKRTTDEHIAVPVPDAGLDKETVEAVRNILTNNIRTPSAGHRGQIWELARISRCACGATLGIHHMNGYNYYVCSEYRRDRACPEARYHRAEPLEERVRAFTRSLLMRPEIIVEQTASYIESERKKRRRDPAQDEAILRAQLAKLADKEEGYLEQHAEKLISMEKLKAKLKEISSQQAHIEDKLEQIKNSKRYLASLEKMAHDFVLDLPDLLKYLREGAAAEMYRDVYERLKYRIIVHKDGQIDVFFGAEGKAIIHIGDLKGERTAPPPPEDPVWDKWKEGDPIPEPTGEIFYKLVVTIHGRSGLKEPPSRERVYTYLRDTGGA